jgi:syntaxin 16
MIKESDKELRVMMQGGEDKDADIQIKRNIQQTYLYKL